MKCGTCNFIIGKVKTIISLMGLYLIVGLLFISTGGAWISDAAIALDREQLRWWILVITIIVGLVLFLIDYNCKIDISEIVKKKMFITILCMFTYFYKFQGDFEKYLGQYVLLIIWFVLLLVHLDSYDMVWDAFINIAVILGSISLFYYVLGTCIGIIPESSITSLDWGVWDTSSIRSFHNLYYEAQFLKTGDTLLIPRNCGIFSEAPMYNFVLCIALAAEMFISKKVHKWKVVVLLITIITTFSTTGFIFLIIGSGFYFANIIFGERDLAIYKTLFKIISGLGMIIVLGVILHKMTSVSGAGSFNVRSDHALACFKAWISSPILGVGFQNMNAVLAYATHVQGISVGLLYLLATGGILLTSILIIPYIFNIIDAIQKKNYNRIIFETLFLLLYFFTAVTQYPIFIFYIAYSITTNCKRKEEENRKDSIKDLILGILKNRRFIRYR